MKRLLSCTFKRLMLTSCKKTDGLLVRHLKKQPARNKKPIQKTMLQTPSSKPTRLISKLILKMRPAFWRRQFISSRWEVHFVAQLATKWILVQFTKTIWTMLSLQSKHMKKLVTGTLRIRLKRKWSLTIFFFFFCWSSIYFYWLDLKAEYIWFHVPISSVYYFFFYSDVSLTNFE